MAFPLIAAISVLSVAYGAKKGFEAKEKNERANRIVSRINSKFEEAKKELDITRENVNELLESFAKFKLLVFTTQIKTLVNILSKCKKANSKFDSEHMFFTPEEIKQLNISLSNSIELAEGLEKGVTAGALTAFGVYGSVGMLASASTGTAISALSGAAATNATLAWLGGGSLAAGGFGVAGGMVALGGLVAGPAIAITGLVMDSKAEENLSKAYEYESEVEIKIEKIMYSIEEYGILMDRINELGNIINKLANRFDGEAIKLKEKYLQDKENYNQLCNSEEIDILLTIGKNLKNALDIPLLDEDGNNNKNYIKQIRRIEL